MRFEGLSDCVRLASATNHGKNPGLILRPACKVPPLFPKELSLRCATKRTACCRRNSWIVWNILTNRSSPGLRFLLAEFGARTRGIGGRRGFDTASAGRLRRRQGGSRGAGPGGSTCRSPTTSTGRLPPMMRLAGHSANASLRTAASSALSSALVSRPRKTAAWRRYCRPLKAFSIGSGCPTSWRCGLKRAWRQLRAFFSPITAPGSVAPRQNDGFCSRRPLPDRPARSPGGDLEATSTRSEMVNASSPGPLAGGGEARRADGKRRPRGLIEPAMMPAVVTNGRARRVRASTNRSGLWLRFGANRRSIDRRCAREHSAGRSGRAAPGLSNDASARASARSEQARNFAHDDDRRKHGSHHTA